MNVAELEDQSVRKGAGQGQDGTSLLFDFPYPCLRVTLKRPGASARSVRVFIILILGAWCPLLSCHFHLIGGSVLPGECWVQLDEW